ncbi:MAG: dihydrolipoyl dehydrogenase [candidate division Zixibacteria bacterium]|nr:dihydrolipoyl dehydrogenase [candidate division Zixibacteria bacterium]
MPERERLAIIGGGPAGYVGAVRAAQLGAEVTLIEKKEVGGTCLNEGCIPTKTLTSTAHLYRLIKKSGNIGIEAGYPALNWEQVMRRKEQVVRRLVNGVKYLLKERKVALIQGTASFLDEKTLLINKKDGGIEKLQADKILISTGSVPVALPVMGADLDGVVDSSQALSFEQVPSTLLIVGGGYIGCEFASIYHSFGAEVTIVEMLTQILPGEDEEIISTLRRKMEKEGIKIYTESKVSGIFHQEGEIKKVKVLTPKGELEILSEKVLTCVGRKPYTDTLNLKSMGITQDDGKIKVDEHMRTNLQHIYSAGDCLGGYLLAHVASMEAECAVENMLGGNLKMDYTAVPRCIFTYPEIGGVGLTEKEALEKGFKIKIGRFPFTANGRALAEDETEGMVKIIAEDKSDKLLGAIILGNRATDLIAELTLGIGMGIKLKELIETIHAHPTLAEAIRESALKTAGRPLHIL